MPLRDFKKKIVKIEYIVNNVKIQTVMFEIEEDATALQWIKKFETAASVKICKYF